nr:MAG: putative coat protein [Leviviridae sp.]
MAFTSTFTITVNAVAKILNRINQDNYGSEYLLREALQEFRMKVRHSKQKPAKAGARDLDRHNLEITQTIFAVGDVLEIVRTVYLVYTVPYNDDLTQATYLAAAFGTVANNATVQSDLMTWQN